MHLTATASRTLTGLVLLSSFMLITPLAMARKYPGGPGGAEGGLNGGSTGGVTPTAWPLRRPTIYTADAYLADASESIQDAIDAASDWDVIFLGPDTWWTLDLDFGGKAIWLMGSDGTLLRSSGTLSTTSGTPSSPARLRISDIDFEGQGQSRAIHVSDADVEVLRCTFTTFDPEHPWDDDEPPLDDDPRGGAVLATDSDLLLRDCTFSYCSAERGGGVALDGGVLDIDGCAMTQCSCHLQGGAIYATNCTLRLTESRIADNNANIGGGLFLWSSEGRSEILHTNFYRNSADTNFGHGHTGAVHAFGPVDVKHSQFMDNSGDKSGAMRLSTLYDQVEGSVLYDCMFSGTSTGNGTWDFKLDRSPSTGVGTHVERVRVAMGSPPTEYWLGSGDETGRVFIQDDNGMQDVTGMLIGDGGTCPFDLDQDGSIGMSELLDQFRHWGNESLLGDYDSDRILTSGDLVLLLQLWGDCQP